MRTSLLAASLLFITSTLVSQAASGWMTDYEAAAKKSKETGKPILANFTGSDWCGWCIKLHKEVFNKAEFKTWAEENVVLLELDYPRRKKLDAEIKKQNGELKKKYAIRGFPTVLLLDAEGKKIGKTGYRKGGPQGWTEHAQSLIDYYDKEGQSLQDALPKKSGRIEGKLISKDDKEMVIETPDGKRIRIPLKMVKEKK